MAVDRTGKKFINCEVGSRGTETGKRLGEKISPTVNGAVATDHWKAYCEFIPEEQHIQSKKETYTVEGDNRIVRHFLARLRRRTKCYTKAKYMFIYSLKLLMLRWTHKLSILC
jgi:insertion element IS1 protein InsB